MLLVRKIVDLADQRAILDVETALARPVFGIGVAEVPFADDRGLIARGLQRLRQQVLVGRQAIGVVRRDDRGLQAVAERVAASHQRRSRLRTERLGVEFLEPGAAGGERVDVGRLDVGAVVADVLPTLIVGDDVDDVGRLSCARGGAHESRCYRYNRSN